jgi:hypothetical protein
MSIQSNPTPRFVSTTFTQRTDAKMTDMAYYYDNSSDLLILLWGGVNNVIITHNAWRGGGEVREITSLEMLRCPSHLNMSTYSLPMRSRKNINSEDRRHATPRFAQLMAVSVGMKNPRGTLVCPSPLSCGPMQKWGLPA